MAPEIVMTIKVVVFFLKPVSLTHPCLPAAPKSVIYYSMTGLAILDFTAPWLMMTALLAVVHVGLLILVRAFGMLCMY